MTIKVKLTAFFLIFAVIAAGLTGALNYYTARKSLMQTRISALEGIADLKVRHVESFFNERRGDVVMAQDYINIKNNIPVLSRLINDRSNPAYKQAKHELDVQLQTMNRVYVYKEVILLDADGIVVYTSANEADAAEIGQPLRGPESKVFEEGKKEPYLSDIFARKKDNTMYISAPVNDFTGKFIGVVALEIDVNFLYTLVQDTTGLGVTGETLLVKRDGDGGIFLNPLRHDREAALKRRVTLGAKEAVPAQLALQGRNEAGVSTDYRGKEVLAVWRYIPSLGWGMVAKIDAEEAVGEIQRLGKIVMLMEIATLLVAVLVAFAIARSISRPIEKLQAGAEVIGSGNLNYRIGSTEKDEIGRLSQAFDRMAERLERTTASRDDLNREIIERTQIERELKDLTVQLNNSNEGLKHFAYIASHDLQEPLRMVSSYVQLLARRYKGRFDADADDFMRFAVEGTERMQRLIADLLAYSTMGAKARPLEPTNCEKVIEIVMHNMKLPVQESGAVINCGPLPTIMADSSQMIQLFQNLISNAIKYRSNRPLEIGVSAERDGNAWRFAVKDNGIGIAPESRERIFMIFQRIHGATQHGSGIGLASCVKIVERHGGRIWVESKLGEGSTFLFTMPDAGPELDT